MGICRSALWTGNLAKENGLGSKIAVTAVARALLAAGERLGPRS